MDPIYKPLSEEEKAQMDARGYKQWEYFGIPNYADPDSNVCKKINLFKILLYFL